MKKITNGLMLLIAILIFQNCNPKSESSSTSSANTNEPVMKSEQKRAPYAIAIHGGAGVILKKNLSDEKEKVWMLWLKQ